MYDTARAALLALTDDELFERVAVKVLRPRYLGLRITGPSGDLNRDAFSRPLFGERDEIVLLVSCEARWTAKLRRDLDEYRPYLAEDRPEKAIFVTNRSTKQTTQLTYKKLAGELGINLEVVDLNELAVDLDSDSLHRVAEYDLGVRPRKPRVLQPVAVFREQQEARLPDFSARIVGRDREMGELRDALAQGQRPKGARVVVIEGPAGVGKSRLAVDGSHAMTTTLVAVPGTAVTVDSLTDVPLDGPSIVVADDAHRSPDLSGLAAMIGDPRFGSVTAVVTVAAGSAAGVLSRWGLDRARTVIIPLAGLASQEIGEIVAGHGFNGEAFKSHVAEVAQGTPWLAHAACLIAAERKIYRWSDTGELLGQLAEQRLRQAGFDSDEHRAAAVALALLTAVSDGGQLAALAGAVTALPQDTSRLDTLLADLVQAGLAAGPPYVISPAASAPVLVAAALDPPARVKTKLRPALKALGRGAVTVPADDAAPSHYSVLDIGPLSHSNGGRSAVIDAGLLAARLSVLAQAGCLREVPGMLGMLQEAVWELLPDEADVVTWLDVLTVAVPVAAAAPKLAGDLRDTLTRNWPPATAASLWNDDPVHQYRLDIETLVKQAITVGQRASHGDVNRAVGWMLECAWLSEPVLKAAGAGFARQAIRSILRTKLRSAAQTWDDIFQQRQQVLDAVLRWGRERSAGPPAELPAADRAARDPSVAVRVQLGAFTPLLSLVTEEHAVSRPGAGTVFIWSNQALPDDARATAILLSAASAVADMLDQLDVQSPGARSALETIVRLPREIRAEAARGLGHGQPLPTYATEAMNQAATQISDAVASHWQLLPLAIRYAAAESAARPGGRPRRPLAELAAEGDLLAAAAVADPALTQLLTILPIAQPRSRVTDLTAARQETDALRGRAKELADTLPTSEAIDLLTVIDYETASSQHFDCLTTFARAVGCGAADPEPVLSRLLEDDFPAAPYVLSGLLETWPQACLTWLPAHISTRHVAHLALRVADELPAEQETVLLDAMTARLAYAHGARSAGTGTGHADGDALDTGDAQASEPESAHAELAVKVADHLGRCRAQPGSKLARLVTLSDTAPDGALPRILAAVDTILSSPPGTQILDGEDNSVLRQELAAILPRVLAAAKGVLGTEMDYDTATAATSLGQAAPAEIARILIDRTLQAALPVIPYPWEGMLLQTPPGEREPLATAYQEGMQPHLGSLPAQTETAALDVLDVLGRGSPRWAALIRGWAAGNPADRARAAIAVRHRWPDPIWRELVPGLLDTGISEHSITSLRQGIIPCNDAVDAVSLAGRLEVLRPLLDDARPVVRQFADETAHDLRILLTVFQSEEN